MLIRNLEAINTHIMINMHVFSSLYKWMHLHVLVEYDLSECTINVHSDKKYRRL